MTYFTKKCIQATKSNSIPTMKKHILVSAVGAALSGISCIGHAAVPDDALLNFVAGSPEVVGCLAGNLNTAGTSCSLGTAVNVTDMAGSYFSMDTNGDKSVQPSEKNAISMLNSLTLGSSVAIVQSSSGQHTGAPDGSESPSIDNPWNFNGNAGMHTLETPLSVLSDNGLTQTIDMSGWGVNWGDNGPGAAGPTIPMGGSATLACSVDCAVDDDYELDMAVHVPQAFTSVPYTIHLEGKISKPGAKPILQPDADNVTIRDNQLEINVLANDSDTDPATVSISTPAANGTAGANPDGTVTYTPATGFSGTDSFEYNAKNTIGTPADTPVLVSIDVQDNIAPVAVDDAGGTNSVTLGLSPLIVSVLDNDSDANNKNGLPGGIAPASVTILSQSQIGVCTANNDGTITYSQTSPVTLGEFTCTYKISDINSAGAALDSNTAQLKITISESNWPASISPDIIPVLFFDAGIQPDPDNLTIQPSDGSYFSMQLSTTKTNFIAIKPGPSGALVVGHEQPGTGTHTGEPDGNEESGIDLGWNFNGNTGFAITANGGIIGNPDGTLQFGGDTPDAGRYNISWNGIPAINLGGRPDFPDDLGFSTISCSPAPCGDQSTFSLDYAAHVAAKPESGFGGVPYGLHMEGIVRFLGSKLQASNGILASQNRLFTSQTDVDSEVALQCVGDCLDYTIDNISDSRVFTVYPMAGGVPTNPIWRILDSGTWRSFDDSAGDSIQSASFPQGSTSCPPPGDTAYRDLTTGDYCLQFSIADNGSNDTNTASGTISGHSGMGSGGSAGGGVLFVDARTSNTSGCSLLPDYKLGLLQRSEWWVLAAFLAWLGFRSGYRKY